jgi:hypothetical protein
MDDSDINQNTTTDVLISSAAPSVDYYDRSLPRSATESSYAPLFFKFGHRQ